MNAKNPRFSFVIPTLNEEKRIATTLKQFLPYKKSYSFEVIIVDGKSTDNTVKIAKRYGARIIYETVTLTIAAARNKGAFAAYGEYIIEMDADVIFSDIPKLLEHIETRFKNVKIVAATSKFRSYPEDTTWKDEFVNRFMDMFIWIGVHIKTGIARGECQIFRKSAFNAINGYKSYLVCSEDCDIFSRITKIGKIIRFSDIIAYYSPRRFRKEGYLKMLTVVWFWNWLYFVITGNGYVKKWKEVR